VGAACYLAVMEPLVSDFFKVS
ncbi:hypothetical protein A2U01_0046973, partial [Trifolium medium]|nr:hypothetical protein [Trifolium medium]